MSRLIHMLLRAGLLVSAKAEDVWELPPLRYSETLPSVKIAAVAADDSFAKLSQVARVSWVLKSLAIPEESQILVFSKTSKQHDLISPRTPRALYFSANAYAGYVPGGMLEVIMQDPLLGPVFYVMDLQDPIAPGAIQRATSDCLSCHGNPQGYEFPGMKVRSVFPDRNGRPLLSLGSTQVDATTPLAVRWGGYYVSGRSSLPHLGNRLYREEEGRLAAETTEFSALAGEIEIHRYPRQTSDIVALMLLEHQCDVHNSINEAAMRYRRNCWLSRSLKPPADPDTGTAGRLADEDAAKMVDCLLFKNEAAMGDGVEGEEAFQEAFAQQYPRTKAGNSLADFHLGRHLFKNRCSYMIYSSAFTQLPERVKSSVLKLLRTRLEGPARAEDAYLQEPEKKRIAAILRETVPGYAE